MMFFELPEARAFAFGIVLAAAVGPIALVIATNSLRFGLASGIQSALGAALGDLTFAVLATALSASITAVLVGHTRQVELAGSTALILFGIYMIVQASGTREAAVAIEPRLVSAPSRYLQTTFALTLLNPLTVIVFGGFIAQLPAGLSVARLSSVITSLFLGSLVIQLGIAVGSAFIGTRLRDDNWIRRFNLASGYGIIAFGLFGLF